MSLNWVSIPGAAPYLGVKTEGFSRLPNTKQIKYDLFHGKIQPLLCKGANRFSQWRETCCSIELL